jgi:4-alpha-glucanotransferase
MLHPPRRLHLPDVKFPRSSGILLHPTSLPGPYGIGELGPEACAFLDFLERAGQTVWQVLPLTPTGYGDSPYSGYSAFAGNHLLISIDVLLEEGYLSRGDLEDRPQFAADRVDYGRVLQWKLPLLARAAERFRSTLRLRDEYRHWIGNNTWWLDAYAQFMTTKLPYSADVHRFWQFEFFREWAVLKREANRRRIRIMGDVPIYLSGDSADVHARPELFKLDRNGKPAFVAGVPPDYFSATGQLWGNPIYDWNAMERQGFQWWIDRFRHTLSLFDFVRLDHFRGFEAYWQVPAGEQTAIRGEWVKGPGAKLFRAVEDALGPLPVVAENLGVITDEVEALRCEFDYPGMSVLQFGFGTDPQASGFRPHNYTRHLVAFTGTHDNDTTVGWWTGRGQGHSTRTEQDIEREREFAEAYLGVNGQPINWVFIRTIMASVADTVVIPLQDVLGLESEARMNMPGRPEGNWTWRFDQASLDDAVTGRLKTYAGLYER